MTENRFTPPQPEPPASPTNGFVVMPVADNSQQTPMQWLYQQLYVQAQQANQPPAPVQRDLFSVMN